MTDVQSTAANLTKRPELVPYSDSPWKREAETRRQGKKPSVKARQRAQHRTDRAARKIEAIAASERTTDKRRPHSGRMLFPSRLPTHRATTANLQAIYPFVVETGLGSDGVYIGRETGSGASFVYDPWHLYQQQVITNTNVLLAGVLGRGKSALAKTLAYRLNAFGVRTYIPSDPKGEWGEVAEALGAHPVRLGRGLTTRINPLDTGDRAAGVDEVAWREEVRARRISLLQALAETGLARQLNPVERNAIYLALDEVVRVDADLGRQRTPILPEVVEAMMRPSDAQAHSIGLRDHEDLARSSRDATLELRRLIVGDLAGLFDGPTTHPLDFDAQMQVVDTSRLAGDDTAVALLMSCASAWMEAALNSPVGGRRLVIYDEAWRMMRIPALVRRMQAHWKLSRLWGIGNVAIVHRLSDLGAVGDAGSEAVALARGLLADCSTRIIYGQETDQLASTATALGLTDVETSLLPGLPQGRGLWKVGRRSFLVDHVISEHELTLTDTDGRMR